MLTYFRKYQGTGNDFVMINNINSIYSLELFSKEVIERLCNRRFGIGGDGLIILQSSEKSHFRMKYYNSDGRESTMCGNGGRCIVQFAHDLGLIKESCEFEAIDGIHTAILKGGMVHLSMNTVEKVEVNDNEYILDTGSPHYVKRVGDVSTLDMRFVGSTIRYSDRFVDEGINVNMISKDHNGWSIRTYERGVEDETLSCGTGVTASAIAIMLESELYGQAKIPLNTLGGRLEVSMVRSGSTFSDIQLIGPAQEVFTGSVEV